MGKIFGAKEKSDEQKKDHQKNLGKMSKKHELVAKRFENIYKWVNLNTFWKILAHGVRGKSGLGGKTRIRPWQQVPYLRYCNIVI